MRLKIGTNIHLLNDFKPDDYYLWTYYIFFVNKKKTKDVGDCANGLWRNGNNSASMWLTMWSDSGAGDFKAVSMQMVDSWNILCDW